MIHIPVLRAGKPYRSLSVNRIPHVETGQPFAEVSQANRGLIARDLLDVRKSKRALEALTVAELLAICKRAATLFMEAELPIGDATQSPEDYVTQTSATTGLPQTLVRRNMDKVRLNMDEMEAILGGLTRGLDLSILDFGWGVQDNRRLSYAVEANALGAILPSNSPGVHSLWIPAIALKVPVVLKPGSGDPWTPFRIVQALIEAGCPREAFNYYPCAYDGATEILLRTERSMLFGGASTVKAWENDHRVQIHGPGWSKVVIGDDRADSWEDYLDLIAESVAANGGRSCINASGVWTTRHGRELADALAVKLAQIQARPLDHPDAEIAAFANPKVAERISDMIDSQLKTPGATDLTLKHRGTPRFAQLGECGFLNPTVIWCDDPTHSLANTELLFPFVSVVEAPQEEMLERMGSSLVVTALTDDQSFIRDLLASPHVDRLNLGAIPTNRISWDQPHEGNLFEHLYRQRAFQATA
ncbi:MAG: aldehyde dehydrogenase family protein [Candidatus Poribacteria bacterium]|nr:aldehyde dehydrogenase family protein [Candidatus Poribacteria bacterium]